MNVKTTKEDWFYLNQSEDDPNSPDPLTDISYQFQDLKVAKKKSDLPNSRKSLTQSTPSQKVVKQEKQQVKVEEVEEKFIDLTLSSDDEETVQDETSIEKAPGFSSNNLPKQTLQLLETEVLKDAEKLKLKEYTRKLSKDPLLFIDNIPITSRLLAELIQTASWLNDESINAYTRLLSCKYPKSLFLNTFFYTQLCQGGYSSVSKWTRKYKRGVYHFERVFFPVNRGNSHWALGHIDLVKKQVGYYDSMEFGSSKKKFRSKLKSRMLGYLKQEYLDKGEGQERAQPSGKQGAETRFQDTLEDFTTSSTRAPQQADGGSCGVYVCFMIKRLAEGIEIDFSPAEADLFRRKMAFDLVSPLEFYQSEQ